MQAAGKGIAGKNELQLLRPLKKVSFPCLTRESICANPYVAKKYIIESSPIMTVSEVFQRPSARDVFNYNTCFIEFCQFCKNYIIFYQAILTLAPAAGVFVAKS